MQLKKEENTMKKTYMQPLTKVVKVNAEQMICQSMQLKGAYNSSTMTIADKEDDSDSSDDLW